MFPISYFHMLKFIQFLHFLDFTPPHTPPPSRTTSLCLPVSLLCSIMEWITKRTRHYPDVEVTNFTDSLADGRALLAILDDQDPSESPYDPTDSPAENLKR